MERCSRLASRWMPNRVAGEGRRRARAVQFLRSFVVAGGRFEFIDGSSLSRNISPFPLPLGCARPVLRPLLTSARTGQVTPVVPPFRSSLTHGYGRDGIKLIPRSIAVVLLLIRVRHLGSGLILVLHRVGDSIARLATRGLIQLHVNSPWRVTMPWARRRHPCAGQLDASPIHRPN